jgi:hypothetical protein
LTGSDILTGVLQWFLFQNGNFPKAAETADALRMHYKPQRLYNAATVEKCVYPIPYAQIAGTTRVKKYWTLEKNPRKSKQKKKRAKSPFFF